MSLRSMLRQTLAPDFGKSEAVNSQPEKEASTDELSSQSVGDNNEEAKKVARYQKIENVTEIPEASAYVAGLASRPALAAVNGMISSFPIPKIFASNAIPLFMYMREEEGAK